MGKETAGKSAAVDSSKPETKNQHQREATFQDYLVCLLPILTILLAGAMHHKKERKTKMLTIFLFCVGFSEYLPMQQNGILWHTLLVRWLPSALVSLYHC